MRLKKWADTYGESILIMGSVASCTVFLFFTFMTVSAAEKAHTQLKDYVDFKIKNTEDSLSEMKQIIERIDARVYDLHKERGMYGRKTRD
jgi:hypothetical protein